jgi:hypothetical protein
MDKAKLSDFYPDENRFKLTLQAAEKLAEGDWAEKFVNDVRERYEKYGKNMWMTEKQFSALERISEGS